MSISFRVRTGSSSEAKIVHSSLYGKLPCDESPGLSSNHRAYLLPLPVHRLIRSFLDERLLGPWIRRGQPAALLRSRSADEATEIAVEAYSYACLLVLMDVTLVMLWRRHGVTVGTGNPGFSRRILTSRARQVAVRLGATSFARVGPTSMRKPLSRPERDDYGTSQTSIRRHPPWRSAGKEYAVAPIQYRGVAMRHVGPRDAAWVPLSISTCTASSPSCRCARTGASINRRCVLYIC
jgi:hypothetical protein